MLLWAELVTSAGVGFGDSHVPDHIIVIIFGVSVIWVCFCDRQRVFEASVVGLQYLTSVSSVERCPLLIDV